VANTAVKFGFRHIGYLPGFAPDYQMQSGIILSANSTKIFRGDPVCIDPTSGAVVQGANNTSTLLGIFDGCMYTPVGGTPQWSPFWPGAAGGPAVAYYINSPGALFMAAALNTSIVTANIGENVGFTIGTGNTATGVSAATLDQASLTTTITMPFRVVDLASKYLPAGTNGADVSTAFAWAVVAFNNQQYKTQTAVV
jgi:hypothetical protein